MQDSVPVELPFSLAFEGPVAGTLTDANGQGTGFTGVIPYSGTRLPADGSPSDNSLPAYEASRLTIGSGRLSLLTNKGIDYLTNNNQLNVLVVKVDSERKLQIDVTLVNPFYGTASQQAGIWFGLDDKTFLKLVARGNRVELRREINDASSGIAGTLNPDQRLTPFINGLQNQLLRLRLVIDPVASTAEGFYSIDGINYTNAGSVYTQPALSTAGMGLHASTAFAGIYATHRSGTTPVTFRFDDFEIRQLATQLPVWDVKVNFQDPQTIPPAGWLRDYGQPFGPRMGAYQGDSLSFGWKRRSDASPLDLSTGGTAGNGRNRGIPQDVLLATLMHMQGDDVQGNFNGTPVEGYWEIQVLNGVYDVTLSAGDADVGSSPEVHSLNVEGVNAIPAFTPAGAEGSITRFKSATVRVNVNDGFLTITADGGTNTKINSARIMRVSVPPEEERPYVISSTPSDGATDVSLNTVSIAANHLHVPVVPGYPGGVDNSTITSTSVFLTKSTASGEVPVTGVPQGTGGGDAISFTPADGLEPNTVYTFTITDEVKSYSGASFIPFEATFATEGTPPDTGNNLDAVFTQISLQQTQNKKYSSLAFGPDGKLYALRLDGVIERYTVNHADGSLSGQQVINTLVNEYGVRSAVGLAFDPQATAANPVVWISHSYAGLDLAPDFSGNISRLSGSNLQNEQLMVTHLPRSKKDHMTNSLAFGPDGALYISQGGNSSMGAYDPSWQRNESLLAAAVLRLDLQKLASATLPLDVQTTANQAVINGAPAGSMTMSDGTYNPYGTASPLTIYASGVRNAYDLLWHTNGQLYVPVNGSGGGGNTPASVPGTRRPDGSFYSGPAIPGTADVRVQNDWLLRINPEKEVGYFGHPNPLRGEYVANRGYVDNPLYPASVVPDINYRSPAFNFETNKSPNGVIEYKSETFNGALKGKLLVCRFSGGGDIMVLEPGSMVPDPSAAQGNDIVFDIIRATAGSGDHGLVGMSGFANPLDIVEDTVNGNLYVIEFNWNNTPGLTAGITLLKAGDVPETEQQARINFQEAGSAIPSGYTADSGLPFNESRGFGWIDPQTGQPKDHTASMRTRAGTDSLQLRSLAHMQATTGGQSPGSWEFAMDSGWYSVTISAGDPDYFNSTHQINVEGVPAVTGFVPNSGDKYRRATVIVRVEDGRLTLDASGGDNTKINYVLISPTEAPVLSDARITVQNMDLFPAADHLVFSRIQVPWRRTNDNGTFTPYNANHDKVKLRIANEGTEPLIISEFSLSQPARWRIMPNTVPVSLAPGAFTEITIEFIAEDVSSRVSVVHDVLQISSNDATMPLKTVMLHGLWQRAGEGIREPYAQQVINAFNFKTRTGYNSHDGSIDGETIVPNSDEIVSPFFERADATKPVSVIQLAAYHGCCASVESFRWYAKGSASFQTLFTHNPLDGQSVLPRLSGSSTVLARGTFNPASAFGIRVGTSYTDRERNAGDKIGIRIWKAIDSEGNPIPNAYIMGGDYLGTDFTNYDYQDNIYYIENVRPEGEAPELPPGIPEPEPEEPQVEEPGQDNQQATITAYPNPNSGSEVRVRAEHFGPSEEVTIEIRDVLGREVYSQSVTSGADGAVETTLQPGVALNTGIYIIRAGSRSGNDDSILIVL
ncbi:Ig-like domain-containing protein [Anseongella ginsenosidimutans]|uniref:Ig-like domain-containing protein n=1 Tax=Anseongella ginsenosidimutans TaxID=496056 RepID=UPI0013158571|nr:Ig-like domain-containing protein [Anseongella ginsenosidimutans]